MVLSRRSNFILFKMLAILVIFVLAFCLLKALPFDPPTSVIESPHATLHEEAEAIRQCAKDPANWEQIWINSSLERFNCLIHLPDGRIGNWVLQPCKRGILEITAYILSGGKLEDVITVLTSKACARVL